MESLFNNVFFELSAILIVSTSFALLARWLKQPIVLAFLLAGIVLGPIGFDLLRSHELIDVLAEFGLAFLLYVIGIELDLRKFRALSRVGLIAGLGQVVFTGLIGIGIALWLGFSITEAWFIAIALTFSSTIVVVKILSEKRELQSLFGRIAIAVMIIQDFAAVFALLILESFGVDTKGIPVWDMVVILFKTSLIALLAWGLSKYVFKNIFKLIGTSQELLFLWSMAWCLLFATFASLLGFSIGISVFIAGLALASLDYNYEIASRVRSLRDFFIVIFFTLLGSELIIELEMHYVWTAVVLSLFVLIGNPFIVYVLLRLMKYTKRTALFVGLCIGQISEFSFIIANVGLAKGILDQQIVSMIAIIGVITMVVSTYFITYNERIYKFLEPLLIRLPFLHTTDAMDDEPPQAVTDHIVLFGYHVTANSIIEDLKSLDKDIVIVDYNPSNAEHIKALGVYYVYGDMRNTEILEEAQIDEASLVISIVPYPEPTFALLQYIKHFKIEADVVVSARNLSDTEEFYKLGATFVLHPESISLDYLRRILDHEDLASVSDKHQKHVLHMLKDFDTYL